jgi:3-deoxy-D-manno-octulosonic-acid transferase
MPTRYPVAMLADAGRALMRWLYTLTMYILTPVIIYRLAARGLRLRGYYARWLERFGFFPDPGFADSIWVHAVSVGEVNAAAPLVDALRRRYAGRSVVVTTVTPTGSERVRRLWGEQVFHVYLPYDLPAAVKRFMARVRPSFAVIMETEIWPNLFLACHQRGIPIVVANARLSERSLRGYGPVRPLARMAIRCASHVAAQSVPDAERLLELGADPTRLSIAGNLKYDMAVPAELAPQAARWRAAWGGKRPVWIAASTHEGEEEAVIEAHSRVLHRFPDALVLIAPRHPERFRPVLALCRSYGFATASRSEDRLASPDTQCFVVDTLGELLAFYAAADVAFVGGSLEAIGGHNLLEPAALGVPVLVGPHTFNFTEVTDLLLDAGAVQRVADPAGLAEALPRLLSDPARRDAMGQSARATVERERGAVARTLAIIERVAAGQDELPRSATGLP